MAPIGAGILGQRDFGGTRKKLAGTNVLRSAYHILLQYVNTLFRLVQNCRHD